MATRTAAQKEEDMRAKIMSEMEADMEYVSDPVAEMKARLTMDGFETEDAVCRVYRVVEEGKRQDVFLYKCPPEDFDDSSIGKQYGSGIYRVKVYARNDEHPNGVIKLQWKFPVEMPPGYKPPVIREETAPIAQPAAITPETLAAAIKAAMPQQPAIDPVAMMMQFATLMKTLQPAAPAAAVAPPTFAEQITQFATFHKLLKEIGGGDVSKDEDGKTDIMGTLVKTLAPALTGMVSMAAQQQAGGAVPALPAPGANPAQPVENEEDDEMKMMVGFAMRRACAAAKAGDDAEDFAEKWYNDIPEEVILQLRDDPEWFKRLCEVHADCANYEPWFGTLRALFVEWYEEDLKVETTGELDKKEEPAQAVSDSSDVASPNVHAHATDT